MTRALIRVALFSVLSLLGLWMWAERGRLLRPSTARLLREAARNGTRLHTYLYARLPREYIGLALKFTVPRFSPRSRQNAADHYHGKVLPTELATALISVNQAIHIPDLEQIIPYPVARELILNSPPEVVAFECPCRMRKPHHCEPTQVCMIVGQPFVDFMLEHHPARTRRLTPAEAITLLEEEHARGHIHAAYFKDAMLNRFYAICNCCACCCGAIEAMQHGVPMIAASGFVARVNPALCAACGQCATACPFHAIQIDSVSQVDWQRCMGCGVCVGQCPNAALTLERDERKGIPLDVRKLA